MLISAITPTHDARYLEAAYLSLKNQTHADWEWVLVPNGKADAAAIAERFKDDGRVKVIPYAGEWLGIGHIKRFAFGQGTGEWLVELDHDDMLHPEAFGELAKVSEEYGFAYSDCVDFSPEGKAVTYHDPNVRKSWEANGFKFATTPEEEGGETYPLTFEPSAAALSLIYYAPNHFRAWRRNAYHELGGHNPEYKICDDHELLVRTYLKFKMFRIARPLYWYRVESNTWSSSVDEIRRLSYGIRNKHIRQLIVREAELKGEKIYDLGGAFGCPPWAVPVDRNEVSGGVRADLNEKWPFEDNSVFAFRASDILEHLPNKLHVMSEIHRCLMPGGWLMADVPSALGQGAFQDPTHCSYWVENSFKYYTERRLAKYIRNDSQAFVDHGISTVDCGGIPYVTANLLKPGEGVPGYSDMRSV